jgi:hypothetical protein
MTTYPRAAVAGALGGLAGAAAMAATAKLEQLVTKRPDSYVPGRTLAHLLRLPDPGADRLGRNWAMHYGTGATVGALRGVWSAANLRGLPAAWTFTHLRLGVDQTLENATGVGAPPWTWPRDELAIDYAHKAVYSLVTGAVADALVEPHPGSSARRKALGKRLKGHA